MASKSDLKIRIAELEVANEVLWQSNEALIVGHDEKGRANELLIKRLCNLKLELQKLRKENCKQRTLIKVLDFQVQLNEENNK